MVNRKKQIKEKNKAKRKNIKYINTKLISIISLVTIITNITKPIFAQTEENVYGILQNNGNVEDVILVKNNIAKNDEILSQYGNFVSIDNLSSENSDISLDNDEVTVKVVSGNNFYKGSLLQKELPWNISIKYYLDDELLEPQDLASRSGNLKILIDINKNNQSNYEQYYNNYLLQVSLNFDMDKVQDLVAKGAIIANVGSQKQVIFNILPGNDKHLEIDAQVEDFELPDGISFNAFLMSMDVEIDTSSMTEKTDELEQGVNELHDGANELVSASNTYKNAINTFTSSINQIPQNSKKMQDGIEELLTAIETINNSIANMEISIDQVALEEQISNSTRQIATQSVNEVLTSSSNTITSSLEQIGNKTADSISTNITNNCQELINKQIQTLQQKQWFLELSQEQQLEIINEISNEVISSYTQTGNELNTSLQELQSQITPIVQNSLIETNTKTATKVGTDVATSTSNIINENISQLLEQNLTQKLNQLKDALSQVENGTATLYSSYTTLDKALNTLNNATNELNIAYEQLNAGTNTLGDGINELYDKTYDISEQLTEQVDNILDDFDKSNIKPTSFASTKNGEIDSLEFIIKTKGIVKSEQEQESIQETSELSLWQKFINLFKKEDK